LSHRTVCIQTTVFGKHCECNAQKCTHLKRLPSLASHLLLLSHCALTKHEGQKKSQDHMADSGNCRSAISEHASVHYAASNGEIEPDGSYFSFYQMPIHLNSSLQITTCAENGKIQITPKITNHLHTCYLNCMCKSNPVCLIQQWSVIFLLASHVQ